MCTDRDKFLDEYHEKGMKIYNDWRALLKFVDETEDICGETKVGILLLARGPAAALDKLHGAVYDALKSDSTIDLVEGVQGLNDSELRKILEN